MSCSLPTAKITSSTASLYLPRRQSLQNWPLQRANLRSKASEITRPRWSQLSQAPIGRLTLARLSGSVEGPG